MSRHSRPPDATALPSPLRDPAFRALVTAHSLARFGSSALVVLLGIQLYALTADPFALGWLGLAEAMPAISLVLYGGHVADRHSRRTVSLVARSAFGLVCLAMAACSAGPDSVAIPAIYLAGFLVGCAGAFAQPAAAGLEGEVVPAAQALRGASLLGSASQTGGLAGPILGSALFAWLGPAATHAVLAAVFAAVLVAMLRVPHRKAAPRVPGEGALTRIAAGIRAVRHDQVLLGSMALDMFAMFFGGAQALFPVFAADILQTGPAGVGWMRAAASIGSLAAMVVAVRHPPRRRAGLALHLAVAGYGVAIIVFALSRNLALSLGALACAGAADGISMVVRQAILRLRAPGPMRGRISAVRSVFLNASNELGDFESGMLAGVAGAVASVWIGGAATLAVVALTAWRAPVLRRLDIAALEAAGDPAEAGSAVRR